jgi:nucleotide-binding universal stress UspA family protein
MMYRTILVPLDGSPTSERALPIAAHIARRAGAVLHLVHVHTLNDPIRIEGLPVIDDELHSLGREHERIYLEQMRGQLSTGGNLQVTCETLDWERSVAHVLNELIMANPIDLVVMSTHGRSGCDRLLLGSVAEALTRAGIVPLLLVRPTAASADFTRDTRQHRILLPLDGSTMAEQIVPPALALGTTLDATYELLRVLPPPVYDTPETIRRVEADAQSYLTTIARRLRASGATATTHVACGPQPTHAILDVATQIGADLIAIATHSRSSLHLGLGSTTDKLIRSANQPLLVYQPALDEA